MNIIDDVETENQPYDAQAQLLKVLTHPARLAILSILREHEQCVCHIEAHLGYRQAYISQQLAVLREAGLIQDRREGWNIYYSVTNPKIFAVLDAVQWVTGTSAQTKKAVHCPCPKCNGE